jgi:hypothetical protein
LREKRVERDPILCEPLNEDVGFFLDPNLRIKSCVIYLLVENSISNNHDAITKSCPRSDHRRPVPIALPQQTVFEAAAPLLTALVRARHAAITLTAAQVMSHHITVEPRVPKHRPRLAVYAADAAVYTIRTPPSPSPPGKPLCRRVRHAVVPSACHCLHRELGRAAVPASVRPRRACPMPPPVHR